MLHKLGAFISMFPDSDSSPYLPEHGLQHAAQLARLHLQEGNLDNLRNNLASLYCTLARAIATMDATNVAVSLRHGGFCSATSWTQGDATFAGVVVEDPQVCGCL